MDQGTLGCSQIFCAKTLSQKCNGVGDSDAVKGRGDTMLERLPPRPRTHSITRQRASRLLDSCIQAKVFRDIHCPEAKNKEVKFLKKPFIKFETFDCLTKPVYKELTYWPEIFSNPEESEDSFIQTERKKVEVAPKPEKMTRRGGGTTGGPQVASSSKKDFIALDNLISAGADVSAFLHKAQTPMNGERRSLRKVCNGDTPDDKKSDKDYYKVIGGPNTKLRSSGHFQQQKVEDKNGLVVKFRKVRKSELSVLSDEAEQFMFPKKDDSSTEEEEVNESHVKPNDLHFQNNHIILNDRRRSARPVALKEESSSEEFDEDAKPPNNNTLKPTSSPYHTRKKVRNLKEESSEDELIPTRNNKRRCPNDRKRSLRNNESDIAKKEEPLDEVMPAPNELQGNTLKERCWKWRDGRLRLPEPVEELTFSFETMPSNESWYSVYTKQDEGRIPRTTCVQDVFKFYLGCPRLPYEMPPLPPLKPGCCHLYTEEKALESPSKWYGTRLGKKQKPRKRKSSDNSIVQTNTSMNRKLMLPRKSPREHASTLAILGTLRNEDSSSLTSIAEEGAEDEEEEESPTIERLLETVFDDAYKYEIPYESIDDLNTQVLVARNDVATLISNYDGREMLDLSDVKPRRRGKWKKKKKNRTGWPIRKKQKSPESDEVASSRDEDNTSSHETVSSQVNGDCGSDSDTAEIKECKRKLCLQPVVRVTKLVVERKLRSTKSSPPSSANRQRK